jgi:pyridoxamine 5'-phosphate oxidase
VSLDNTLPDPLPENPLQLAASWLAEAFLDASQPNPNAMVLATVDDTGRPSARVVLCKEIAAVPGSLVFYSNYASRKGRELAVAPRAAVVFHWDHRQRQVRAEGLIERVSGAESDAYFRSRPWQSRLGAWASAQSEPLASRHALIEQLKRSAQRFGIPYTGPDTVAPATADYNIPRPPHWGGYRLHAEAVELWTEAEYRIHDRARWTRHVELRDGLANVGPWHGTRLQP